MAPRAQLADSGAVMWQSGTAPPRRDIWVLGGGVTDGSMEAGALYQPDAWAQTPREPWGWHWSLPLAAVPTRESRPGRILECQLLRCRRGAGFCPFKAKSQH